MYLDIDDLKISYEKYNVIDGVNLSIEQGDIVSIIGRNGCGKSTILKAIINLLSIDRGKITFRGKEVKKYKAKELAQKIAFLSQQKLAYPDLTVETLVSYGRYPHLKFGKFLNEQDRNVIDKALHQTGIYHLKDKSIKKLSGGERQRAWIAMAICQEPEILILDEPTTYLDIAYQIEVLELIKKLNEESHMTIIMVLHDINLAARYSKKIYAIKDKKIYAYGEPQHIVCAKVMEEVFTIKGDFYVDKENEKEKLTMSELEKDANTIVINDDEVVFKDADGVEQTIKKNPKRVLGVYNSYTNLWYEAGGTIIGRIESTTELNENAINDGKDIIVGKTNTTINIESVLDANPDLVLLSSSKQGKTLIPQLQENNIPYISMEYNGISDYLKYLKLFSAINNTNNYEETGKKVVGNIAKIIAQVPENNNPKALLIFGTTKSLKAYLSNTANGEMLKFLGVTNIADTWTNDSVTSIEINEEYVMSEDPDFIFVQSMGDQELVEELFTTTYSSKWASLKALKNKQVIFLDKEWYHYKPNKDYDKAFLKLAKKLYPEEFTDFKLE